MTKPITAWALYEDGELCHYYAMSYILPTRNQARIERNFRNAYPHNHKMEIVEVKIVPVKRGKK